MTIVSEKQAYTMGCLVGDGYAEQHKDLIWFQACDWSMLEGRRKIDFLRGVVDTCGITDGHTLYIDEKYVTEEQLSCVDVTHKKNSGYWVWTDVNTIDRSHGFIAIQRLGVLLVFQSGVLSVYLNPKSMGTCEES